MNTNQGTPNMDTKKIECVTRTAILKLLTDHEIAQVSMMETFPRLHDGDEYINLDHLEQGVLSGDAPPREMMGQVLPRSAVCKDTWSKICERLTQ